MLNKRNTWILVGLRTSKEAVALKEKEATGLARVIAFIIFPLLLSIAWDIFLTFKKGVAPIATRGKSSEKAVNLKEVKELRKKSMN